MAASPLQVARPRVLVCDDTEDTLDMLRHNFRGAQFEAEYADNGEVVATKGPDYDLILTDLAMSPVDGWTAIERVRKVDPDMPVWAISAYAKRDLMNEMRAKELNVLLLYKPEDTPRLRSLIESHFGLNGAV